MEWLINFINNYVVDFVIDLVLAVLILVVGFALVNFLVKRLKTMKWFTHLSQNGQLLIYKLTNFSLKATILFSAVIVLGVPEASIVALIGTCGLTIGLALQGGLSNIASGIIIMITKPFQVGDFIEFDGTSGVAKDIGVYYTLVTTGDNKDVSVPNSVLANSVITNYSTKPTRRLDIDLSIGYTADIELTRKVLLATASMNDMILKDPAPAVFVTAHGESGVAVKLRIWCKAEDYWTVNFDMWEDIKSAFDKFDIEIPYNYLNVNIKNDQ